MAVQGWDRKYKKILRDFGYSQHQDEECARLLDSILDNHMRSDNHQHLKSLIWKKPVFVIGAGPSITRSLPILKKHKKVTKIAADGAVEFLLENNIHPEIVVTDLDGNKKSLLRAAKKGVMVTHAHGDNIDSIGMASHFPRCVGTTQSKPVGQVQNFGGFTDGDRAVFLADYFGARKIILLGMDFGNKIGRYSNTKRTKRQLKLKKLKEAEYLISWLATKNPNIVSTSTIKRVQRVAYSEIDALI